MRRIDQYIDAFFDRYFCRTVYLTTSNEMVIALFRTADQPLVPDDYKIYIPSSFSSVKLSRRTMRNLGYIIIEESYRYFDEHLMTDELRESTKNKLNKAVAEPNKAVWDYYFNNYWRIKAEDSLVRHYEPTIVDVIVSIGSNMFERIGAEHDIERELIQHMHEYFSIPSNRRKLYR